MRIKICGITKLDQGQAIAQLGASALGFICVPQSPRFVSPHQICKIVEQLPQTKAGYPIPDRVGVFVNSSEAEIVEIAAIARLNVVQLHGSESPQFCQTLKAALPTTEIIKALRVRDAGTLAQAEIYANVIDTLLLDAYVPNATPGQYGGTGQAIDWGLLQHFRPACPWLLAGGLSPSNILNALSQVHPDGIDLSSGVEIAPGDKDLAKVKQLFIALAGVDRFEESGLGGSAQQPIAPLR
ncbi:phosphoribosylanthranilate isomerase [Phormidium tenue FACHB-886]|nr:phosphoribosylanthranilate isomerase [Phormidium tenue FACHB-886]